MNSKGNPFFSVVVPTYERPDDLRRCLNALKPENQQDPPSYELIVTDDSHSNLCQILVEKEFPQVSWGKGKQNGPAANRNAGVARAQGEWIVFIDDDCIAQPGYLAAYESAIKSDPTLGALEGRIFPDRPRQTWAEGCPVNETGGMFWTSNLCVMKKIFLEMGGLDEQFQIAFEDVEFAYRIQKQKIPTSFEPKAAVCHPWRPLIGDKNWKCQGYENDSLMKFLRKHPEAKQVYGNPKTYLRNLFRMISSDLFCCLIKLRGRGIRELCRQIIVTSSVLVALVRGRSR